MQIPEINAAQVCFGNGVQILELLQQRKFVSVGRKFVSEMCDSRDSCAA